MRIATLSTCTYQGLGTTHAKDWGLARAGKQKCYLGLSGCVGREFPEGHTGVAYNRDLITAAVKLGPGTTAESSIRADTTMCVGRVRISRPRLRCGG